MQQHYDILTIGETREITLCGMSVYPMPEPHPDRVMLEHDLLFMDEGEWVICQDSAEYTVRQGDAMLLRAGSHHYSLTPCAPGTRTLYIHMTTAPTDRTDVPLTPQEAAAYASGGMVCLPTVIPCGQHAGIRRAMRDMAALFWSDREDRQRHMGLALNVLLSDLAYIARGRQAMAEPWLQRVLRQMRTDPSHMYSLAEIAEIARMSVRSLSSHFKRETGQTVHQYQLNLKLEMAFALVRTEPDRTLADIAANFGFYDAYHFSRLFKQRFGFSPRHFRGGEPTP